MLWPILDRLPNRCNITLLAPDIIKAAVAGDEPPGLSVAKLRERLPAQWDEQLEWFREE